jgi:hypothetical protein
VSRRSLSDSDLELLVRVWDAGEGFDRFSAIFENEDGILAMSHNAASPQGVCTWVEAGPGGRGLLGSEISFGVAPQGVREAIRREALLLAASNDIFVTVAEFAEPGAIARPSGLATGEFS